MAVNRGAFPTAVHAKTVKDLRAVIANLPDDMLIEGFYDDAFGSGIVWIAVDVDESSGPLKHSTQYLAIDVERDY